MPGIEFPSGPWTGFYNYSNSAKKHRMDLVLTFANHVIWGDERDDVGLFVVGGRFDEANGECYWTKTYIGAHDVYYRGSAKAKESGACGTCRAIPAVFISGRSGKTQASTNTKRRKNRRQRKQSVCCCSWGRLVRRSLSEGR
jgi:hypothetical protein